MAGRELLDSFPAAKAGAGVAGTLSYSERAIESLARLALIGVPGVSPARGRFRRGDRERVDERLKEGADPFYVHVSGLSGRTVAFEIEIAVDGHEQITQVADRARRRLAKEVHRLTGKRCVIDVRVVDFRE